MHTHSIDAHRHEHVFLSAEHTARERRTWTVVALTVVMMVAEIAGGWITGSMALMADGWHMSTHAAALGIAAVAYRLARTHAHNEMFAFGTGKMGELAGYTSAVLLGLIAILIGYESASRLLDPEPIAFDEAIIIAVIGLAVNLGSAWLLGGNHGHRHGHGHARDHGSHGAEHDHHTHDHRGHEHPRGHGEDHHHDDAHQRHVHQADTSGAAIDHNITAAYYHVLADALTSVLAIVALALGWMFGWYQLDAFVGIVGAVMVAIWAVGLMRSSAGVLLDTVPSPALVRVITAKLETGTDRVSDLHVWRLGPGHSGVIASVISENPQAPAVYKDRLAGVPGLSHITVEVHACRHGATGAGC